MIAWPAALFLLGGLALGRLLRHTGLVVFITLPALPPFLLLVADGRAAIAATVIVAPMLIKRVLGNEPLPTPHRWRAAAPPTGVRQRRLGDRRPLSLRTQVDFRRLLVGQGASALGDWMGTFALMALVDHLSGSATAVGGILAFRLIPAALGGTLAAKLVRRWDRRRTMITMDLLRAGMIAVVPFVQELWWVYLWAFLLEAPSVVFLASRDSAIPDLVDESDLPLANAAMMGSSYGNIPVGAGLFAAFAALPLDDGWLGSHPYALVFWLDALTFGVSAWFIARALGLRGRAFSVEEGAADEALPAEGQAAAEDPAAAGGQAAGSPRLRDAWSVPLVRRVLPATAAAAVGLGALFSLGIKLVREELHASDIEYGVLIVLFGAGAGVGLALTHRSRHVDLLVLTRRGALVMGALVALMSQSPAGVAHVSGGGRVRGRGHGGPHLGDERAAGPHPPGGGAGVGLLRVSRGDPHRFGGGRAGRRGHRRRAEPGGAARHPVGAVGLRPAGAGLGGHRASGGRSGGVVTGRRPGIGAG